MNAVRNGWRRLRTPQFIELRSIELFNEASVAQLRQLARTVEIVTVSEDTVIIREGSIVEEFIVVLDGYLERRREDRHVGLLHPGHWTDAVDVLLRRRAETSVVAATPAKIAVLGVRQFRAAVDETNGMGRHLLTGPKVARSAGALGRIPLPAIPSVVPASWGIRRG